MPEQLTAAAVMLEAARRMYPDLIFAIVATDNNAIDVTSNALDPGQVIELLTDAAQNIRDHGAKRMLSPHNPN